MTVEDLIRRRKQRESRRRTVVAAVAATVVAGVAAIAVVSLLTKLDRVGPTKSGTEPVAVAKPAEPPTSLPAPPASPQADKPAQPAQPAPAAEPKNAPTAAAARALLFEHLRKAAARPPAVVVLPQGPTTAWSWKQYDQGEKAADKSALYALLADHLAAAEAGLKGDLPARRSALGVIREAARCASRLKDDRLSVLICDAFVVPHFDDARQPPAESTSWESLLTTAVWCYTRAKDDRGCTEACRRMLAKALAADDHNTADAARFMLADLLERQGAYAEAVSHLEAIDAKGSINTARLRIPGLRAKLQAAPAPAKAPDAKPSPATK